MKRPFRETNDDDTERQSSDESSSGSVACCDFLRLNKKMHLSSEDGTMYYDDATLRHGRAAATQVNIEASGANSSVSLMDAPHTMTDGERLLAKEMNSLSLNDRESVYEDIHGVMECIEETDEFVETKLRELEDSIQNLRKKDAYAKAAFLSPRAVQDRKLRIQLLRTAYWEINRATKLLAKHFEYKLRLFGDEIFVRPLRWSDLSEDAQKSLEAGSVVRYEADYKQTGRSIMILNYASFSYESPEAVLQSMFYTGEAVRDKSAAARKGLIAVINTVGSKASQIYMAIQATQRIAKWGLTDSLPIRFTSNHFCLGETWMKPYISMLLLSIAKDVRLRTKFHMGSFLECKYELGAYGIPVKLLPFDGDGNPNTAVLQEHTAYIRSVEQDNWDEYDNAKPEAAIHYPQKTDVVMGRGWSYQNWHGNLRLVEFLQREKPTYDDAPSRMEKTLVTAALVVRLRKSGVRFLKRDASGMYWNLVDETASRHKVAMSIRNIGRKSKPP